MMHMLLNLPKSRFWQGGKYLSSAAPARTRTAPMHMLQRIRSREVFVRRKTTTYLELLRLRRGGGHVLREEADPEVLGDGVRHREHDRVRGGHEAGDTGDEEDGRDDVVDPAKLEELLRERREGAAGLGPDAGGDQADQAAGQHERDREPVERRETLAQDVVGLGDHDAVEGAGREREGVEGHCDRHHEVRHVPRRVVEHPRLHGRGGWIPVRSGAQTVGVRW